MGYLFLGISLIAGVVKGYCSKKMGNSTNKITDAILINLLRMIICIFIGFAMVSVQSVSALKVNFKELGIMFVSGIMTSLFVVFWLIAIRNGTYMLLNVFLMVGVFVTLVCSYFMLGEKIEINHWVGLVILFVSVLIMCSYDRSQRSAMSMKSLMLLIAVAVTNGLTDFSQKFYVNRAAETNISVFNFYTYVFSAAVLTLAYFIFNNCHKYKAEQSAVGVTIRKFGVCIVIMSICLFLNSFFKTKAAIYLPATQIYPAYQGGGLILSTAMAAVCFGEKVTLRCVIGLCMAFASLLVINMM